MNVADIEKLIQKTAKTTVRETLRGLGIDVDRPIEVQKDFQALHDWRVSMSKVRSKALVSAVGVVVAGILAALWLGIKSVFVD